MRISNDEISSNQQIYKPKISKISRAPNNQSFDQINLDNAMISNESLSKGSKKRRFNQILSQDSSYVES